MDIPFISIFVVAIIQMGLGMLWYGPFLFGKKWMEFMGVAGKSETELKAMQKDAQVLYIIQFLLSLLINTALAYAVSRGLVRGPVTAFAIWFGFIMPIQASAVLWDNLSKRGKWQKFLIMTGYQLISLLVAGLIFERTVF